MGYDELQKLMKGREDPRAEEIMRAFARRVDEAIIEYCVREGRIARLAEAKRRGEYRGGERRVRFLPRDR